LLAQVLKQLAEAAAEMQLAAAAQLFVYLQHTQTHNITHITKGFDSSQNSLMEQFDGTVRWHLTV
jgi:hypothetical protein